MDNLKAFEIKENIAYLKSDAKFKKACREAMFLLKKDIITLYLQISVRNVVEVWYSDKQIKAYLTKVNSNFKVLVNFTEDDLYKNIAEALNFLTGNNIKYKPEKPKEIPILE